jgi:predicted regulator of Ras-like GTPase activity (Roadblock/LC7/MglB family)
MAQGDRSSGEAADGFAGGVAGLDLAALVQLNVLNRFSGCFRVSHEDRAGMIFFRDGEIVHAEEGSLTGEEAFGEMVTWPGGHFSVEPNVMTALRTIHKSCDHLLLDAHRLIDERRVRLPQRGASAATASSAAAPAASAAVQSPAAPRPAPQTATVDLVRSVAGVVDAVLLTKDGRPAGQAGYEAEVLAGHSAYLASAAAELGGLFQAGELRAASARGARQSLLLLAARSHLLGVLIRPDADPGAVEAAIRGALVPKR